MQSLYKLVNHYDKLLAKHIYENSIVLLYTLATEASLKEADNSMDYIIKKLKTSIEAKIKVYKQQAIDNCILDKVLMNKNSHLYIYILIRQNLNSSCSLFESLKSINYPLRLNRL